jgi:hypothetical protein
MIVKDDTSHVIMNGGTSKLPGRVVTPKEIIDSLHHHRHELSKSQHIRANGDHLTTTTTAIWDLRLQTVLK